MSSAPQSRFRFVDLFAGIGGLRLGFEAAGGECVFTSEWDKYCVETYRRNFDVSHPIAGDIRRLPAADIPDFDVLLAGFPCQPFSIAGVSKKNSLGRPHGFLDELQGNLFFSISRILAAHRPAAFLLENVRNLRNHDGGRTYSQIMDTLANDLGYKVSDRLIDARGWVPQRRERIFIAGFRKDVGFDFSTLAVPRPEDGPRMSAVLHTPDEPPDGQYVVQGGVHPKYTLSDHLWAYLQEYAAKHRRLGNGFRYGLVRPEDVSRTLSARYYKDGSEILVEQGVTRPPRRLTPRECARLMGFKRLDGTDWEIPVSDTQAYKQFGNAVVVPLVETVAHFMAPYILRAMSQDEVTESSLLTHG